MRASMPTDRDVLALAVPALGALIAEPLYVLGDTAIVGHLGTVPLAGLALGGLMLGEVFGFCTFLEYGTTAKAARLFGADQHSEALDVGVQATWLALLMGALLVGAMELAARPAAELLGGGSTPAVAQAVEWLRIASFGAPAVLVVAAAQGWLRGFQNTRTPLVVIGVANVASVGMSALLVNGVGLGIRGSAIANVAAQTGSAAVFLALLGRTGAPLGPHWSRMRGQLAAARDVSLRTLSFFVAFTIATGVAARISDPVLAAQQIGVQLWGFCALFMDSTAIAAQALVGRLLGADQLDWADRLARRLLVAGTLLGCAFALVLAGGYALIPHIFTSDPRVLHQTRVLWPWLVVMMPAAGYVFALDGVLFGAGDLRFLRDVTAVGALAGFVPLSLASASFGWGLSGLWAGLAAFVAIRLVIGFVRWRGGRWLVGGVAMVDEAG